jgi:ABC transport system ATP-binding/permease protein
MDLLKGDLLPDCGTIKWAEGVRVVAFDQNREQLNREQTLKQALCPLGDQVIFRGETLHVTAWAKRFLFPKEKLALPVSQLSGGEQARVLIANLMLKPADILLLDEPTNDLDIPTLEVLEESLQDFPGALVLVTHDRFLMNRLSDRVLYLDGEGRAEFFADYAQWLDIHKRRTVEEPASNKPIPQPQKKPVQGLSYEERKELNRMEQKIAKAEEAVAALQQQLHDPEIMTEAERLADLYVQLQEAENKVEQLYQRWEALETLSRDS